jgi:hypothetical protein
MTQLHTPKQYLKIIFFLVFMSYADLTAKAFLVGHVPTMLSSTTSIGYKIRTIFDLYGASFTLISLFFYEYRKENWKSLKWLKHLLTK